MSDTLTARQGTVRGGASLPRAAWIMTQRELLRWWMHPWTVVIGWLFPVLILLMFAGLFGGAMQLPGTGSYLGYLMPGILTLSMLFGLEATAMAVSVDRARGVTDRFRSLPISSASVLLGRCLADLLNTVIGLAVVLAAGWALGWRWETGVGTLAAAVALLLALRGAMLWLGIWLGLLLPGLESLVAVQILVWPVGFLSSAYVDPATMPGWLGAIAAANPISFTATAIRQLNGEPIGAGAGWLTVNAVPLALVAPVALVVICLPLAAWQYRRP